ncbi:PAS domain-containing sensor histidine kinase [Hymenobacter crusticola]|uniref:histidine kinase n=1 Tax=Hymenobacter crusticola TaxID=1770526 RepID=A0A243W5W1_9BACT|nr:PAS domain-containing sensor histidine kinase [Hymenobacter crusticola]OUJ69177.1 hypothetical protein BXP70_26890 [Hymenobacter crusticola]
MPTPAAVLPDEVSTDTLLLHVLDVSLTGIQLLRPVYAAEEQTPVDFAFVYTNPAGLRISRVTEPLRGTLLENFPHTHAAGVLAYYQRAFAADEPLAYEVNYQADGLDNYLRFQARRSGEHLLVSFTDTSDQPRSAVEESLRLRQATEQAALAEAERQRALLYRVFEQAPAMICILQGPEHVFEFVNPPYQALVGERLLVGKPIAQAMPELAGQPIFALLDRVYRTGEIFHAHEMLVQLDHANDGRPHLEQRYYNFIYKARYSAAGQVDGILVFAYEVTPQVQARAQVQDLNEELAALNEELRATNEEYLRANTELAHTQQQLRQLNQELEQRVQERTQEAQTARLLAEVQKQRLEQLFLQAPAAICILDGPALVYELVNPAYQQLFPGRTLRDLPLLEALPELRDQPVWHTLQQVYRTGQTHLELGIHIPVARTEGGALEDFYFNYIQQARFNEQGQVDGAVVFAFDVTEQVRARQQVQDLNEELAALNEELTVTNEELHESNTRLTRTNVDLDTFVYTASHDLKAPITNIESILLALRDTLPAPVLEDAMVAHLLDLLGKTVARFQFTIGQLTDITRLQLAHTGPLEPVELARVVADVRLDLAPLLQAASTQLTVDVAPALVVSFSPANLRSVIYNLLSNAVKYRGPNRPNVVQVRATQEPGRVVLTVQDNGLGMTQVQQRQLFGLFQRLHTHVEGTGVGLYITKRLIENAGGTIAVQSQPEQGTTFTVTFPA